MFTKNYYSALKNCERAGAIIGLPHTIDENSWTFILFSYKNIVKELFSLWLNKKAIYSTFVRLNYYIHREKFVFLLQIKLNKRISCRWQHVCIIIKKMYEKRSVTVTYNSMV